MSEVNGNIILYLYDLKSDHCYKEDKVVVLCLVGVFLGWLKSQNQFLFFLLQRIDGRLHSLDVSLGNKSIWMNDLDKLTLSSFALLVVLRGALTAWAPAGCRSRTFSSRKLPSNSTRCSALWALWRAGLVSEHGWLWKPPGNPLQTRGKKTQKTLESVYVLFKTISCFHNKPSNCTETVLMQTAQVDFYCRPLPPLVLPLSQTWRQWRQICRRSRSYKANTWQSKNGTMNTCSVSQDNYIHYNRGVGF